MPVFGAQKATSVATKSEPATVAARDGEGADVGRASPTGHRLPGAAGLVTVPFLIAADAERRRDGHDQGQRSVELEWTRQPCPGACRPRLCRRVEPCRQTGQHAEGLAEAHRRPAAPEQPARQLTPQPYADDQTQDRRDRGENDGIRDPLRAWVAHPRATSSADTRMPVSVLVNCVSRRER